MRHHLVDTPPLSLSEGGLLHDGVDPVLDGLRNQLDDQEAWLSRQEAIERRASGNPNLRLQYHRTFGYFLAVSRARAAAVPDHWIRRQTLANEERFVTPELKGREGRILQLRARACQREYDLFCDLRRRVGRRPGRCGRPPGGWRNSMPWPPWRRWRPPAATAGPNSARAASW